MKNECIPQSLESANSIVEVLRWRATHQAKRTAVGFLNDDGTEKFLTYAELDIAAAKLASSIQSSVSPGDRVLLCYPPGIDFFIGFFGCLYARAVAVPVFPPRNSRKLDRLASIVGDAKPKAVLTTSSVHEAVLDPSAISEQFKQLHWILADKLETGSPSAPHAIDPDGLVFLQYTSGSTSIPKGVMLSHRSLLANLRMLETAMHLNEESVGVTWLPVYHDLGLIGCFLMPLSVGFNTIFMSPGAFLQKPMRWLQAISRFRGTVVSGPNFAYELCTRAVTDSELASLDLSSLKATCNGAEPVRADTLQKFATRFERCGFSKTSFLPSYGLAEATVFVSGGPPAACGRLLQVDKKELTANRIVPRTPNGTSTASLIGCGTVGKGLTVCVVDPETRTECSEEKVGEIWVAGPSIADGYWNRPDLTKEVFKNTLSTRPGLSFLRTGDYGVFNGGELYITGRLKDILIIHGRNHYPTDIELVVEKTHPAFRPGMCAAFSIEGNHSEEVALAVELDKSQLTLDFGRLIQEILMAVADEHELNVSKVFILKPRELPKTTSGKLQRALTKKLLESGKLQPLFQWPELGSVSKKLPSSPLRDELLNWFSRTTKIPIQEIDAAKPLVAYGLDSLMAYELSCLLEERYQLKVPPTIVWDYPTLEAVVGYLEGRIVQAKKIG